MQWEEAGRFAWQLRCLAGTGRGARRGGGGASKTGWAICSAHNFRLRNLIRLLDLSQTENGRPLGAVIGSGHRRTQMRGGGGGGAAQDEVDCLAVSLLPGANSFWHDGHLRSQNSGLDEPSRKELPTRAVCQALKVGIFVNAVITLSLSPFFR